MFKLWQVTYVWLGCVQIMVNCIELVKCGHIVAGYLRVVRVCSNYGKLHLSG